jgi:exodeoxyribonuclease-5
MNEPDYFLTEIHRQHKDNPIIHISTLARNHEKIPNGEYGNGIRVIPRHEYDLEDFDPKTPPQLIVGTNKTRWTATRSFREYFVGPGTASLGPRKGEPLLICKNSTQFPDLVNGTIVKGLTDCDLKPGTASFKMDFIDEDYTTYRRQSVFQGRFEEHFSKVVGKFTADNKLAYRVRKHAHEVDWAWAITGHKSQGSQWDDVIVIDESSVFGDDAANHLYTTITRAAKTLTLVR